MRKFALYFALACVALSATVAHAAHITCNNTGQVPNANLIGYDFSIDVAVNNTGGSGGGSSKATTSLSVTLPIDASTVALSQLVATGKHTSSCTISDAGTPIELVLSDVIFTKFEIVNGPASSGKTASIVQLDLSYSKYAFTGN